LAYVWIILIISTPSQDACRRRSQTELSLTNEFQIKVAAGPVLSFSSRFLQSMVCLQLLPDRISPQSAPGGPPMRYTTNAVKPKRGLPLASSRYFFQSSTMSLHAAPPSSPAQRSAGE